MASSAGEPVMKGRAADRRAVPFDDVLVHAQAHERARLLRFRRRWVARHVVVIAAALLVLARCGPALVDGDEIDPFSGVGIFVMGGWFGLIALVGLVGFSALAIPFAIARIVAVCRSHDLGAFERAHAPWWVERVR